MFQGRWVTGLATILVCATSASARKPQAVVVTFTEAPNGQQLALLLQPELAGAGYAISDLDAAELVPNHTSPPHTATTLTRERFDLLVLPDASTLPAGMVPIIERFLRGGGDIIALNAPLWQRALMNLDGKWRSREEYARAHAADLPEHIVFSWAEPGVQPWQRQSNHAEFSSTFQTAAEGPAAGHRALHVTASDLQGWDTYLSPVVERPFADGGSVTVFSARGGPRTDRLMVEWRERDGSRWIAVVVLKPEWQRYVLEPREFKPWPWTASQSRQFNPAEAVQFCVGLAFSHTGQVGGAHAYWLGSVGTATLTPEHRQLTEAARAPALDTLSPAYKLFDCSDVASLSLSWEQTLIGIESAAVPGHVRQKGTGTSDSGASDGSNREQLGASPLLLPVPQTLRSPHPRPQGHGFAKGRTWRWIPLLEARTAGGEWRGTPATLLAHVDGPYKGGLWASFGIADPDWYRSPDAIALIGTIARRMRERAFILDAGADHYTYFEGQEGKVGLTIASLGQTARSNLTARITVSEAGTSNTVVKREWPVQIPTGQAITVSEKWVPKDWPSAGYRVVAELLADGKLIDRIRHDVHVWRPNPKKRFVTVKNGGFELGGRPWRVHGLNYMPSSGIGTEDMQYFEHWLGRRSYDPEIIQRDLNHMRDLGFNAVSIFIYHHNIPDQNLLDLLRRLDLLGMKANVSLRPGDPMHFKWETVRDLIQSFRLAENDTVFAYDLAWEPMFRGHEWRLGWDRAWEDWIVERYGSIAAAEKDWGFAIPRDEKGAVTNPLAHHVDTDGPWRRMVAAYRRFLDTLLYQKYSAARRLVRNIDPHHLVSFRMAECGNPTFRVDGWIPYDFPYLAAAVDMLAPEAYGRIGDWEQVKPGVFEVAYGRWATPEKPLIWAEAGNTVWDGAIGEPAPQRLKDQAELYRHLYHMLIMSGSDGIFFWWYPGGFRVGENSDFGIINPDGSDRAVTTVIRENGPRFLAAPPRPEPDFWIEFDRDAHPSGITGAYDALKETFWKAIADGHTPGLRTAGTGKNSANCPELAVGNSPLSETNPPKYLDAAFDAVEIRSTDGEWLPIEKNGRIELPAGKPAQLRIQATNLGEATWLTTSTNGGRRTSAAVALRLESDQGEPIIVPLSRYVAHFSTLELSIDDLPLLRPNGAGRMTLVFESGGHAFGERYQFTLNAAPVSE